MNRLYTGTQSQIIQLPVTIPAPGGTLTSYYFCIMNISTSSIIVQTSTGSADIATLPTNCGVICIALTSTPTTTAAWSTYAITLNNTPLPVSMGGSGSTTGTTFNPMTTTGDMIYSSSGTTASRLPIGSTSQVLTTVAGVPSWAPPATAGTVTSVDTSNTANVLTVKMKKLF